MAGFMESMAQPLDHHWLDHDDAMTESTVTATESTLVSPITPASPEQDIELVELVGREEVRGHYIIGPPPRN